MKPMMKSDFAKSLEPNEFDATLHDAVCRILVPSDTLEDWVRTVIGKGPWASTDEFVGQALQHVADHPNAKGHYPFLAGFDAGVTLISLPVRVKGLPFITFGPGGIALALARVVVMASNSAMLEDATSNTEILQLVANRHRNAEQRLERRRALQDRFGDSGAPARMERAVRLLRERGEMAFLGLEVGRRLWGVDAHSPTADAAWKLKAYGYTVDATDDERALRWAVHKLDCGLRLLLAVGDPEDSETWLLVAEQADQDVRDALSAVAQLD